MFAGRQFTTTAISCLPGDVFLMLTDGVLEIADKKDEEFGLASVKKVLSAHARQPLSQILDVLWDATNRHGHADDDRSVLLIRHTNPAHN